MLWTKLVLPLGRTSHEQCDLKLAYHGYERATAFGTFKVANQLVQVVKSIYVDGKLIAKWISIENGMQPLLMETVHVDVSGDGVALGFRVG